MVKNASEHVGRGGLSVPDLDTEKVGPRELLDFFHELWRRRGVGIPDDVLNFGRVATQRVYVPAGADREEKPFVELTYGVTLEHGDRHRAVERMEVSRLSNDEAGAPVLDTVVEYRPMPTPGSSILPKLTVTRGGVEQDYSIPHPSETTPESAYTEHLRNVAAGVIGLIA